MKRMKKVVLIITFMVTMIITGNANSLFAATQVLDPSLLGGEENVIKYIASFVESTFEKSEEEILTYIDGVQSAGYSEDASSILMFYNELVDCGGYVDITDCVVTYTENGFNAEFVVKCSERNVEATANFELMLSSATNQYQAVLTSATAEAVYTFGEKMEKAALNTLMGMGTVFVVLIFMTYLFSLFKYISKFENMLKAKREKGKEVEKEVVSEVSEANEVEEDEELVDDLELVAVITAAIAASENTSADGLVVRSIKRANNPKWRKA